MPFRPTQSNWLETFVPREKVVYAVEALAATNLVELELDPQHTSALYTEPVKKILLEFDRIRHEYADHLPAELDHPAFLGEAPDRVANRALQAMKDWSSGLAELLEKQGLLSRTRNNLLLLQECLSSLAGNSQILASLSHHTDFLYKGIFACAKDCCPDREFSVSTREFSRGKEHDFVLLADTREREKEIKTFFRDKGCRHINIPAWMPAESNAQTQQLEHHLQNLARQLQGLEAAINSYRKNRLMAQALANMSMLRWYVRQAIKQDYREKFCHLSGWAATEDLLYLQNTLEKAGIPAVIRFAKPPLTARPPVSLFRSWWTMPFQVFLDMSGTPGRTEIDPSPLLPLIVPLLFGYMFPDTGHGLMLTLLGILLYKRWPAGHFLIPCGISASLFGIVFGEVFGMSSLWAPLWLHPLDNPLEVLVPPLVFGALLILLGLVFNGIEAYWEQRLKSWLLSDAAVLTLYLNLLSAIFFPALIQLIVLPLLWYLAGSMRLAGEVTAATLLGALGKLLESSFLLAINTFSFLRVGAFALAHAGLSSALLTLASYLEQPLGHFLFLLFGHVFLVALEGLVVFVQATRLVLFEFLIRFLRADGRIIHPIRKMPGRG